MDIAHIAKLANLQLTEPEAQKYSQQLDQTLSTIELINQLDTTSINPTSQVTGLTNISRPDTVDSTRILTQQQALQNSPKHRNGYFEVPAIFENS